MYFPPKTSPPPTIHPSPNPQCLINTSCTLKKRWAHDFIVVAYCGKMGPFRPEFWLHSICPRDLVYFYGVNTEFAIEIAIGQDFLLLRHKVV